MRIVSFHRHTKTGFTLCVIYYFIIGSIIFSFINISIYSLFIIFYFLSRTISFLSIFSSLLVFDLFVSVSKISLSFLFFSLFLLWRENDDTKTSHFSHSTGYVMSVCEPNSSSVNIMLIDLKCCPRIRLPRSFSLSIFSLVTGCHSTRTPSNYLRSFTSTY